MHLEMTPALKFHDYKARMLSGRKAICLVAALTGLSSAAASQPRGLYLSGGATYGSLQLRGEADGFWEGVGGLRSGAGWDVGLRLRRGTWDYALGVEPAGLRTDERHDARLFTTSLTVGKALGKLDRFEPHFAVGVLRGLLSVDRVRLSELPPGPDGPGPTNIAGDPYVFYWGGRSSIGAAMHVLQRASIRLTGNLDVVGFGDSLNEYELARPPEAGGWAVRPSVRLGVEFRVR